MQLTRDSIEFFFSAALFINALLFIPQIRRIIKEKSSSNVSLITFVGFLFMQFTIVLHGFIEHDTLLVIGYILSMMSCGTLVVLILMYRNKQTHISNLSLDDVLEQLPGHIYWKDKEGVCQGANHNNWQDFGMSSLNEFVGKTDYDLFSKAQADHLSLVDQEVMRGGKTVIAEEWIKNADGSQVLYLSHKVPLKNHMGEVVGIIGNSLDITQSKQETLDQLDMLENIISLMPSYVYWMNREGVYLGCNDNEAKVIGLASRKDIVGKRNIDMPGFLIPEVLDPVNQKVIQTAQPMVLEEPAILPDGTHATFLSSKVPLRSRRGDIVGMLGISIDITERKKAEQQIQEAKDIAEASGRAKTQFLQHMRHDLRTPFSGILNVAESLEKTEMDPKKKENIGLIVESSKILLDQLNEIFEFVRMEDGKFPVLHKKFDLHKTLDEVHAIMRVSAKVNSAVTVSFDCDPNIPRELIGDHVRTQRILMNLVSNAIKFTHEGFVSVHVDVAKETEEKVIVRFVIADTGVGIPENRRDFLFENFNRLTGEKAGIYVGKGLGLSMVKHFLEDLHGEIDVKSELGKGSTFTILIPYKKSLLYIS